MRPAFFVVFENVGPGIRFQDVLISVDEEAAGAGRGVANALARTRIGELDHHANDVAWRTELAVRPCGIQLREHVLEEVALNVLVLRRDLHFVDRLAGLDQKARLAHFELGVLHMLGKGAALTSECLDEREHLFLHEGECLARGKLGPVRPAQLRVGKDWLECGSAHSRSALIVLLLLV